MVYLRSIAMDKKLLAIATAILLLIGAGLAYLAMTDEVALKTDKETVDSTTASPSVTSEEVANKNNPSATAGTYTEYSASKLAATPGTKILFFHASWCPQCRQLEESIVTGTVPPGVTIFKVDYDTNQQLRQKYGVTIQTTLVKVDDQGNFVEKYVAYDEPSLDSLIENIL